MRHDASKVREQIGRRVRNLPHHCVAQVIVITAFVFPVLLAFLGLALDTGQVYFLKRRMQIAADAAALSGAADLFRGKSSGIAKQSAWDDAYKNGFDFTDSEITVTVNIPPDIGPEQTNNLAAEVTIEQTVPTYFMRVVKTEWATVRARAVARLDRYSDFCVLAMNPTLKGGLKVDGGATLDADCGVMVNSNDGDALQSSSPTSCVDATAVGITGFTQASCITPTPLTEVPRAYDPLAYLSPPPLPCCSTDSLEATELEVDLEGDLHGTLSTDLAAMNPPADGLVTYDSGKAVYTNVKITGGEVCLTPGLYQGNTALMIVGGTVTCEPGIYILDGGLKIGGNATVVCEDVMFYNTNLDPSKPKGWKPFDIAGTANVQFSARSSGDYEGVLFWQDAATPANVKSSIVGNSTSKFEGAFYLPSTEIAYAGTSEVARWTMIVADAVTISGAAHVEGGFNDGQQPRSPARKITLVE